jgi:hypothetical protein
MTTTTEPTNGEISADARRARTLRWLLELHTAHDMPMPKRIDFGQLVCPADGRALRYLTLDLDNDTDVTCWAQAVDANRWDELPISGKTHTWTHVTARTDWRDDGPLVDWHLIEVASKHHYRPRVDGEAVAK